MNRPSDSSEDFNPYVYWAVLRRRQLWIVGITALFSIAAIAISLALPTKYTAEAVILPLGEGDSGGGMGAVASAAASQLGLGNIVGSLGSEVSFSDKLLAIAKSRTLAEKAIEHFDLKKVFFPEKSSTEVHMEDAVREFFKACEFKADKKTGVLKFSGEFKDPELASNVINGYLIFLADYIDSRALTAEKKKRIFIENHLRRNKIKLLEAGKELNEFYSSDKVSDTNSTVDINIEAPALNYSSEFQQKRSEFIQDKSLDEQISLFQDRLDRVEQVKDVPQQVYLNFLGVRLEILNALHNLLSQQYEMAKIEEANQSLRFEVIDWARAPKNKSFPKRAYIVVSSFFLSFILSIFFILFTYYWREIRSDFDSSKISD